MTNEKDLQKDCEECGEPIPAKRLAVRPHAVYCVNCQQSREDKGEFVRSRIEVAQEINGWQFEGVSTKILKGE